jgi:predicted DCC family thiol-disulfide oxidoreductase YuxK
MDRGRAIQVESRSKTPVVVFDGDCAFCRACVARWRGITGDRIAYRPYQEVADRYPEIGRERFGESVWLIEPDGRASAGAHAAYRLFAVAGEGGWLDKLYGASPAFAALSEGCYRFVVEHRGGAAAITKILWGAVPERPRYRRMRSFFLRALGMVYLAAFGSFAVQVDGLIGRRGILPAHEFLDEARRLLGTRAYLELPTLLWLNPSDAALHALCWGGVAVGVLLMAGVVPRLCSAVLWLFYLSLSVAGQQFLNYQWDALLLETGLLAIVFAPGGLWLGRSSWEPSRIAVGLLRWLLFRLMFLSGVVKLASGDPAWRAWEALKYHYETQPLPTWTSWYMHQLSPWFQSWSVGFMFGAELIAPFFIFAPRRPRMVAFAILAFLQTLIAATGNYGVFNLLSLVLCLTLVEDRDWGRRADDVSEPRRRRPWRAVALSGFAAVVVLVTTVEGLDRTGRTIIWPKPVQDLVRWVAPLRSLNTYGLFAIMTTERPEIEVEGSRDGVTWKPYRFRWKPGELDRRPRFVTPHMPRLDWQMWFAALAPTCRSQPWFIGFELRLLEGSPEVLGLLRENPFPDRPPRYVRARLFLYRFTEPGSKDWWTRDEVGTYCPPIRLREEGPGDEGP